MRERGRCGCRDGTSRSFDEWPRGFQHDEEEICEPVYEESTGVRESVRSRHEISPRERISSLSETRVHKSIPAAEASYRKPRRSAGETDRRHFDFLNRKFNSAERPPDRAVYIGNKLARDIFRNSGYLLASLIERIARWTAIWSQRLLRMPPLTMNMHESLNDEERKAAPFMARLPRLLQRFCFSVIIAFRMGDGGGGRMGGATALKHFIRSFISHEEP